MEVYVKPIPITTREARLVKQLDNVHVTDVSVLSINLRLSKDTVRFIMYNLVQLGVVTKKNNGYIKNDIAYVVSNKPSVKRMAIINPHVPYWEYIDSIPIDTIEFVKKNLRQSRTFLSEKTDLPRLQLNFLLMYFREFGKSSLGGK